ncbi:AraC family transcriptional regulator [Microbulbifer sp. SAOS-129_SWC]|uniref:AraC family transcriptional regulator n=1 Tax=Microbulbifer sp. SAOS-129_SWC TaxID=3145235 RepID=UPI003217CBE6
MAELGVPLRQILEGSGIPERQLKNPEARTSFNQLEIIFRNALRLSPRPDIGLLAAGKAHFSDFGIIGFALISARTLADAFELGLRYIRLTGPALDKTITVEDHIGRVAGSRFQVSPELLPIYSEYWLGTMATLCGNILKRPLNNFCLHLPYPDTGYGDSYRLLFNCEVVFDSPVLQLEFDASSIHDRVPCASASVLRKCLHSCESILAALENDADIVHQVKSLLIENPGHFPGAVQVAKELGLSVRSLARKLGECGHSFQSILNDTRRNMSVDYLQQTSMSVSDIAMQLGFSDASSFRKAFKKWTGTTPATFRPAFA